MGNASLFLPTGAKLLDFAAEQEPWCVYRLEDGTLVRAKLVMTKIIDGNERDEYGLPKYLLQWQQIIDVTFPNNVLEDAKKRREQQ